VTGERVVCTGRSGIGVVERVKILRHMARVRWGRLATEEPIKDLEAAPEAQEATATIIARSADLTVGESS
jgi:hypothetical protein